MHERQTRELNHIHKKSHTWSNFQNEIYRNQNMKKYEKGREKNGEKAEPRGSGMKIICYSAHKFSLHFTTS
jgi:hypothetical protein